MGRWSYGPAQNRYQLNNLYVCVDDTVKQGATEYWENIWKFIQKLLNISTKNENDLD